VERGGQAVVVPFSSLHEKKVVRVEVAGSRLIVRWRPGVASSLDDAQIAAGRDTGAAEVREAGRLVRFDQLLVRRRRLPPRREDRSLVLLPGCERIADLQTATMDAALRRRNRDAKRFGDLNVAESLDVAKHDRRAVLERQRRERAHEQVAQSRLRIGRGGQPVVEFLEVVALPPLAHQRLVDGDPVQPREQLRVSAETMQIAPDLNEDVLGRFLDVAWIVEQSVEH
jgi:hypothetical protein